MKALLVIDVQNDFLPGGALAVPEGDAVVPVINELMPAYDLVVATQDWHPENHESFAANHPDATPGQVIDLHGLDQVLWPVHCVEGTPGADFAPELLTDRFNRIFRKGGDPTVDSYSGFFDNGHRRDTGLAEFLKSKGVTEVHINGLATDYCIKFTALDAVGAGFQTVLVEDACRGVNLNDGDVAKAIDEMREAGVSFQTSANLFGPIKITKELNPS